MSAREKILATAEALGLSMSAEFVPFSRSRNKGEKSPSLNWKVSIWKGLAGHDGRVILSTDYSAGCAHCPSCEQRATFDSAEAVKMECEDGKILKGFIRNAPVGQNKRRGEPIVPDFADVIASLTSDASAMDEGTFEEWAANLGYDTDSRSAEQTYRACLDIGLRLRAAIGDEGLTRLREACQDY